MTPNQDTSGTKVRFNPSQSISSGLLSHYLVTFYSRVVKLAFTGSLGWIYANSYVPFTLTAAAGNESSTDITGVEFYPQPQCRQTFSKLVRLTSA